MAYMKKTYNVDPVYEAQMQETDLDFRAHLLKIKSLNPEVLAIGGQHDALARIMQQALEIGSSSKIPRVASSAAPNVPVPELAGDAVKGLVFGATFNCNDDRPAAQAFVKLTREKYGIRCPDHDVSQADVSAQLLKPALSRAKLELTDASLKADRVAIRDALASIKEYQGLAAGPINFCIEPTPQCRDGNRTGILVEYTKAARTMTPRCWLGLASTPILASESQRDGRHELRGGRLRLSLGAELFFGVSTLVSFADEG